MSEAYGLSYLVIVWSASLPEAELDRRREEEKAKRHALTECNPKKLLGFPTKMAGVTFEPYCHCHRRAERAEQSLKALPAPALFFAEQHVSRGVLLTGREHSNFGPGPRKTSFSNECNHLPRAVVVPTTRSDKATALRNCRRGQSFDLPEKSAASCLCGHSLWS